MSDEPKRAALDKVARFLLAQIKHRAPTAKSAASFRMRQDGADIIIESEDEGTIATDRGFRHPLFGDRAHWYGPSGKQRGRKHFIDRTTEAASERIAEDFRDEWCRQFVAESEIWGDEES